MQASGVRRRVVARVRAPASHWLNQFRRLRVRYDKRADIHEAFLSLGCALICWHALRKTWVTGEPPDHCRSFPLRTSPVQSATLADPERLMALAAGARLGPYEILSAL